MTIIQTKYTPGRYGLGTEFSESEIPIEYSQRFVNRFININGDAEKRQGISQLGDDIPGNPTVTGLHELIDADGNAVLMASANGNIYRLDNITNTWSLVNSDNNGDLRLLSGQMGSRHVFVNGSDRNFFTEDAVTFSELEALIIRGAMASPVSAQGFDDSNVENWLQDTLVTENDLVYNTTLDAYGLVVTVSADRIFHTEIGTGGTGLGQASSNQASGDLYRIIDLVSLNIIEQNAGLDNFATATSGTATNQVRVSGVNFSETDIRVGDYVSNTTRSAVSRVDAVSANLTVTSVASQTSNDSLLFFKSAMPIADYFHVHYGRAYYIDSRDPSTVRISGPNDPTDLTTFQQTLETASEQYGDRQPQAERLLQLGTFQQYLVAAGERNVYADRGVNPIQDATAAGTDFAPVGLFPQGAVSRYGLESIGGTMTFAANDGVRNFAASFDVDSFQTANVSESIKSEVANAIDSASADEIQLIHYPRRNWLLCKIGNIIYNYNYTPFYLAGQIQSNPYGSWSTFTGFFAEQQAFLVRRNGDLVCAGAGGKVYEFDKGTYADDGSAYETILETGWLTLNEPQRSTQYRTGSYIKPQFEASGPITYTITATGDFDLLTEDTVTVTTGGVGQIGFAQIGSSPIGGNRILNDKLPLRWKGEQFRIRISTLDTTGPDVITGFTVYGNILGKI